MGLRQTSMACRFRNNSAPILVAVKFVLELTGELSEIVIESLERITNEWQAHFWCILASRPTGSSGRSSSLQMSGVVSLVNLISWEVCRINVGRQLGFKWCADAAKSIKFDSTEEFVILDLLSRNSSEAMFGITNKANNHVSSVQVEEGFGSYLRIKFSASGPSWTSSGK
jgi:hypothetical protein